MVKSSIESVLKMDPFPRLKNTPKRELPSLAQRAGPNCTAGRSQLCHRWDLSAQRGHANSKRTWKNGRKMQASKVWIPHDTPKLLYSSAVRAWDCFNGGPPGVLSGWWFWPFPNMVEKTSTNQTCYITYTLYYHRSVQNGRYPFYLSNTIIIIVESGKKT